MPAIRLLKCDWCEHEAKGTFDKHRRNTLPIVYQSICAKPVVVDDRPVDIESVTEEICNNLLCGSCFEKLKKFCVNRGKVLA